MDDTEIYNAILIISLILIGIGAILLLITLLMLTYHKKNEPLLLTTLITGLGALLLGSILLIIDYTQTKN